MPLPPHADDDPRPQPPERPDDDACCQSGCDPCIFDLYAEELGRYRTALAAWEAREAARQAASNVASNAPSHGKTSREPH
jgi:hypothetical protein